MDTVNFIVKSGTPIPAIDNRVIAFDACVDYDMLNEFFGAHDKSLMCSKEEYFDGFDMAAWQDYAIIENGKMIARAAIWQRSEDGWEVAAVSTVPEYRRMGYGEAVVRYCLSKILEAGKTATCTTRAGNIAMIKTALKAGFKEA